MLIINFEGREAKGLSKGRYDETFAGEDVLLIEVILPMDDLWIPLVGLYYGSDKNLSMEK